MTQPAIVTEALTKRYGNHVGLDGLDLTVERGVVFGFLGPNGAGKTTTIRLLLDLIRPTSGRALVLGADTRHESRSIRARVGYLPGDLVLYDKLTGNEVLDYLAHLRGGVDAALRAELVERLGAQLDRPTRQLSRGNRQKIGLVQAFMHRPELLLLDEPTSGLDPLVQHEFHTLVSETVADGATVFLSSHILSEVQHVAERVGVIREGRLVAVATVEELMARAPHRFELRFAGPVDPNAFATVEGIRDLQVDDHRVTGVVVGSVDALVKAAAHFEVVSFVSKEPELEEVFLHLYGREAPA